MKWSTAGLLGAGIIAVAFALAAGSGCRPAGSTVLGAAPAGSQASVSEILAAKPLGVTNTTVTLEGVMVEKCPVAGCWFKLRDQTGVLKVDTKFSGFVVLEVPLNSHVTVAGRLTERGNERVLVATGLRY